MSTSTHEKHLLNTLENIVVTAERCLYEVQIEAKIMREQITGEYEDEE